MKRDLNASKVFSSMAIFTMLESQLSNLGSFANELTAAKASLDRLNTFLHEVIIDYPDAIRLQNSDILRISDRALGCLQL